MASGESQQGIDFALAYRQQQVRLIELPPSLLAEVVEKKLPLQLKSLSGDIGSNAVLCSSSETFSVRQNQSSNSLFLVETCIRHDDENPSSRKAFLKAVAQPRGMLEITPDKPDAVGHLAKVLPVMDKDMLRLSKVEVASKADVPLLSRAAHLKAAPFSSQEFIDASEQSCAFEYKGVYWAPSPALALDIWTAVYLESSPMNVSDPTAPFNIDECISSLDEGRESSDLVHAVLRRVASVSGDTAVLDAAKCVPWVGDQILVSCGDVGMEETALISRWEDKIPANWRDKVLLKQLTVPYVISDGKIKLDEAARAAGKSTSKATTRPLSKWHEKLMASRR